MIRSRRFLLAVVGAGLCVGLSGCPRAGGPRTVPVKGTLTINGQPASDVTITFSPVDPSLPTASGPVKNGSFELFSGTQGRPGAVPGKYKVVLAQAGPSLDQAMAAMKGAKGRPGPGGPSMAPGQKPSFPEKYLNAGTSDKEVEVKSGGGPIKIDISGT